MIIYQSDQHRLACNALSLLYRKLYDKEPYSSQPVSTIESYSKVLFDNFSLFEQLIKSSKEPK